MVQSIRKKSPKKNKFKMIGEIPQNYNIFAACFIRPQMRNLMTPVQMSLKCIHFCGT